MRRFFPACFPTVCGRFCAAASPAKAKVPFMPSPAESLQMATTVMNAAASDPEADAKSKFLFQRIPTLAVEYSTSNEEPVEKVVVGSGKLVSWKCGECEHVWKQSVMTRVAIKSGCPACEKKNRVMLSDVAGGLLVEEWDKEKNDPFSHPKLLTTKTSMNVWWKCKNCGGSWNDSLSKRVKQPLLGCKHCSLDAKIRALCSRKGLALGEDSNAAKRSALQPFVCHTCKEVVPMTINDVVSGRGCTNCNKSTPTLAAPSTGEKKTTTAKKLPTRRSVAASKKMSKKTSKRKA